jgi:ABC-2 type transport system permease protein
LQTIAQGFATQQGATTPVQFETDILYNPELRSANFMIPGLVGVVMVFIATLMTAVGVVRERERGTLEQLMVTPLSATELM